jgi:hypothetical protein
MRELVALLTLTGDADFECGKVAQNSCWLYACALLSADNARVVEQQLARQLRDRHACRSPNFFERRSCHRSTRRTRNPVTAPKPG